MENIDWKLLGEIFLAFCGFVATIYKLMSKLISKYFEAKEVADHVFLNSISEKIKSLEFAVEAAKVKVDGIKESASSALDARSKEILSRLESMTSEFSKITSSLAVLQERINSKAEVFQESASDLKKLCGAIVKRFSTIESEQIRLSNELIIIREKKRP